MLAFNKLYPREFPGIPVVGTQASIAREAEFNHTVKTRIPQAAWCSQKKPQAKPYIFVATLGGREGGRKEKREGRRERRKDGRAE